MDLTGVKNFIGGLVRFGTDSVADEGKRPSRNPSRSPSEIDSEVSSVASRSIRPSLERKVQRAPRIASAATRTLPASGAVPKVVRIATGANRDEGKLPSTGEGVLLRHPHTKKFSSKQGETSSGSDTGVGRFKSSTSERSGSGTESEGILGSGRSGFEREVQEFIRKTRVTRIWSKTDRGEALAFFKRAAKNITNSTFYNLVAKDPTVAKASHELIDRLLKGMSSEENLEDMRALIEVKFALAGGANPKNWHEAALLALPAVFGNMLEEQSGDEATVYEYLRMVLGRSKRDIAVIIDKIPYCLVEDDVEMLPIMKIALAVDHTAFIKKYLLDSKALFKREYRGFMKTLFDNLAYTREKQKSFPGYPGFPKDLVAPMIAYSLILHEKANKEDGGKLYEDFHKLWGLIANYYIGAVVHWDENRYHGYGYDAFPKLEAIMIARIEYWNGQYVELHPEVLEGEDTILLRRIQLHPQASREDKPWRLDEVYPDLVFDSRKMDELIGPGFSRFVK